MRGQVASPPPLWDAHRVTATTFIALLPSLVVVFFDRGLAIAPPLLLALTLAVFWPAVFSRFRRRPMGWNSIITSLIFVLLVPSAVPLWQQGLALSFGIVMGELIFGDRGRGFLSPAVVALAFLLFSFPGTSSEIQGPILVFAAVTGGAILLLYGLLSWRIIVGFGAGFIAAGLLFAPPEGWTLWQNAYLILGLVFLIGDPVAGASTKNGRLIYGAFSGVLLVILGMAGDGVGSLAPMVFTALLASIFAPLFDQVVIAANVRKRARRQAND